MKRYIALKDNLERIFLSDKKIINTKELYRCGKKIIIEKYDGFYSVIILGVIRLFFISDKSTIKKHPDFIDVTSNELYNIKNIIGGSLKNTNIIIEGADGTGKSTLVNELAQMGYLCQDRAVYNITQSIREYIPKDKRLKDIKSFLVTNADKKVVFLYLSCEEELKRRIFSRKEVTEYDKKAIVFQRLYLDTYDSLKSCENLYSIDVLNKTPKQLADEVIKLI